MLPFKLANHMIGSSFTHAGLPCALILHEFEEEKWITGYVGLPPEHALFGKHYSENIFNPNRPFLPSPLYSVIGMPYNGSFTKTENNTHWLGWDNRGRLYDIADALHSTKVFAEQLQAYNDSMPNKRDLELMGVHHRDMALAHKKLDPELPVHRDFQRAHEIFYNLVEAMKRSRS